MRRQARERDWPRRAEIVISHRVPYADMLPADNIGAYYAWVGDVDKALYWAAKGAEVSTVTMTAILANSGIFDRVRKNPRWTSGLARINDDIWRRVSAGH